MVRTFVSLSYSLLWCAFANSAEAQQPQELKVQIEPAKITTRLRDPIFLRVVLKNESTESLAGSLNPTASDWILKLELRDRGKEEYRRIYHVFDYLCTFGGGHEREMFPPQGQRTTGVLILEFPKDRELDRAGQHELRAYLKDSKDFTGLSEPIVVQLTEISDDQLKAAEEASNVIMRGTLGGISPEVTEKALLAAVEPLEDCELKRMGLLLAAMAALRDANTRDGFEQARQRIAELRKDCPEPMQDWISLTLANTLRSIKQFELALVEIRRLPKDSFEREPIERVILDRLREKAPRGLQ